MQITETLTPVNHDSGRAGKNIQSIVIHTMVGTIGSAQSRFFNGNAQVSANYGIGLDGSIRRWVREGDTAWCNGNYQSNLTSISIEHEDNGDYNGPRTDALYTASAELVADICRRYGVSCDRGSIKGHKEVIDTSRYPGGTACPDALDIDRIIRQANAILNPSSPAVSQPAPSATGETVFLPADNDSWRLYPTDKLPVVGNEKAKLVPSAFGGLTYAVLGHPYANVVTIQSQQFGIGNIWVGSDTNAQITSAPAPAPIAPAIQPAVADKAPTIAKSEYKRLEKPLELIANKQPTKAYNLDAGSWAVLKSAVVKELPQGTSFTAYGKAKHPLGGVYYLSQYSFGDADVSGKPAHNQGINTVDLSPAPAPVDPAPVAPPPITPAPTPVPPATNEDRINVTVVPTVADTWQLLDPSSAGEYIANASTTIHDLEAKLGDQQLVKGKTYHIAGNFTKDKIPYYITKKSYDAKTWYGIPEIVLTGDTLDSDGDIWSKAFLEEAKTELHTFSNRQKAIHALANKEAKHLQAEARGILRKFKIK